MYCTPQMYVNNQLMPDDESDQSWTEWEKIEKEWEDALEKYEARLKEIDDKLPDSVKKFMEKCHLHDATVPDENWNFNIGFTGPRTLQLVIHQKDWGPEYFCILRYKIAHPGHVTTLLGEHVSGVEQKVHKGPGFGSAVKNYWLYDEWDHVGECHGTNVFRHSFYMTNGVEFDIHFTDFSFVYIPVGEGLVEE